MFFVFLVLAQINLNAQVDVERSTDKVIISGQAYYVHIVDSGQTVFSIARVYHVTTETLTRENPEALYGITTGQALKIPVVDIPDEIEAVRNTDKFNYHILQKGESIYSLSRKYDIPEDKIIESNPGVDIYDIPLGAEIAIPKKQFREQTHQFQTNEPGILLHKVSKEDNFSSVSRLYDVSIRDIRKVNRGVLFLREGDLIRIPVKEGGQEPDLTDENIMEPDTLFGRDDNLNYLFDGRVVDFTSVENLDARVNVTLMLPLFLDENSKRSYIDSSEYNTQGEKIYTIIKQEKDWIFPASELFIEFYEGALIAVENLRNKGLDIELLVFDTMRDSLRVSRFLETGRLRNTDIIIGPVYPNTIELVSNYARRYRIPLVSPLSSRNTDILRTNPYLFKIQPSIEVVQEALAETISEYYDHNLIFIHSDTAWKADLSSEFKNTIFRKLRFKAAYEDISFKEVFFTSRSSYNDTINPIQHAMSKEIPNLVILASDKQPVMSEVIGNIHSLLRNYDIKLMGYPGIRWLDNLDPKYFYELGIIIYTPNWVDYEADDVRNFLISYKEKFKMEPPIRSYAWQSYDIMYYFLSGLAIHGSEFMYRPQDHQPDLLQVDYNFNRTGLMNGFENDRLYLIRYTPDMNVEFIRR